MSRRWRRSVSKKDFGNRWSRGTNSPRDASGPSPAMDVSYDRTIALDLRRRGGSETAGARDWWTRRSSAPAPRFPYVPGLLSFRESPAGLTAWERLKTRPDCLLCDGHGYAHPRRFGFACHFGLLVDLPTIGCAKSVLVGEYREPGEKRGSVSDLVHDGEVVGVAARTRSATLPVFVSAGHRVSLRRAVEVVLACAPQVPHPGADSPGACPGQPFAPNGRIRALG